MKKTNAIRELDKNKIKYTLREYKVDEKDLGAIHVALETGINLEIIFKTLSLINDKKELIIACIPGGDSIDLKKLAKLSKCKKIEMLHLKDLTKYTGYVRGGCSPIGIKKKHSTFIHESALKYEKIVLSGGARGLQIELSPKDLINYLNITVGNIII